MASISENLLSKYNEAVNDGYNDPGEVFDRIVKCMEYIDYEKDTKFLYTKGQAERGRALVSRMMKDGYVFTDSSILMLFNKAAEEEDLISKYDGCAELYDLLKEVYVDWDENRYEKGEKRPDYKFGTE